MVLLVLKQLNIQKYLAPHFLSFQEVRRHRFAINKWLMIQKRSCGLLQTQPLSLILSCVSLSTMWPSVKRCYREVSASLHSHPSSAVTFTGVTGSCPPLANRYKASLLQGTAPAAQLDGMHFGHKPEKFGRIFEDSSPTVSAVTNYYKLGDLDSNKFTVLQ